MSVHRAWSTKAVARPVLQLVTTKVRPALNCAPQVSSMMLLNKDWLISIYLSDSGCFCPGGMVLNGSRCVRPNMCCPDGTVLTPGGRCRGRRPVEGPTPRSPEDECAQGMVYDSCGSACPATCDDQSPICTFQCISGEFNDAVEEGCFIQCHITQSPCGYEFAKKYFFFLRFKVVSAPLD